MNSIITKEIETKIRRVFPTMQGATLEQDEIYIVHFDDGKKAVYLSDSQYTKTFSSIEIKGDTWYSLGGEFILYIPTKTLIKNVTIQTVQGEKEVIRIMGTDWSAAKYKMIDYVALYHIPTGICTSHWPSIKKIQRIHDMYLIDDEVIWDPYNKFESDIAPENHTYANIKVWKKKYFIVDIIDADAQITRNMLFARGTKYKVYTRIPMQNYKKIRLIDDFLLVLIDQDNKYSFCNIAKNNWLYDLGNIKSYKIEKTSNETLIHLTSIFGTIAIIDIKSLSKPLWQ